MGPTSTPIFGLTADVNMEGAGGKYVLFGVIAGFQG